MNDMRKKRLYRWSVAALILILLCFAGGCSDSVQEGILTQQAGVEGALNGGIQSIGVDGSNIPAYTGEPYVVVNDNVPFFKESEKTTQSYEQYSELDSLGRCGIAMANIGQDLMPTDKRGDISQVKPTGWQSVQYDNVNGKSLYNRCHLIGFQLAGENANEKNLITGTRYMNVEGMLPFENMVADYVKETDYHVLYRVTPIFEGDNLVASGVLMEAESVEDDGEGILFNVYVYNVQPGIVIDYATGDSYLESSKTASDNSEAVKTYILNTNSKKFHDPSCSGAKTIKDSNRQTYEGSREDLIKQGYEPCGKCRP
ncbi:MAG: DNA/RNA non-specific endonuclease [Clostridiales bacterium]|nr:DNA/RNA non-specific endonuclease [Clostridiales bacterium]